MQEKADERTEETMQAVNGEARPAAAPVFSRPRTEKLVYGLLLALLVLSLFWPAAYYGWANYDDQAIILENPILKESGLPGLRKIFSFFSSRSYYPMRLLSLKADHALWGTDPAGYHLTNVLVHLANTLLLYAFFLRAFPREKRGGPVFAFFTAAFFGLHPCVVDSVAWIAGREELLMLFFLLCGLHLIPGMPAAREKRLLRHVLIAYMAAFSCLSNIYGALFPAFALLCYRLVGGEKRPARLFRLTWYLWLISGAVFFLKLLSMGIYDETLDAVYFPFVPGALRNMGPIFSKAYNEQILSLAVDDRLRLVISLFGQNVLHLIAPLRLPVMYPNLYPVSYFSAPVLAGLLLLAACAWALVRVRRKPLALFCLGWFLVALLPAAQIFPHHIYRADRFLYLPLIGFFGFLSWAALSAARKGRAAPGPDGSRLSRVLLLAYLGLLALRAASHLPVWSDALTLHTFCVRNAPGFYQVHEYLAAELYNRGDFDEAASEYEAAVRLAPQRRYLWMQVVKSLGAGGRIPEAEGLLRRELARAPEDYVLWNNLGLVLGQQKRYEESVEAFREALKYSPEKAVIHLNVAANYMEREMYALAEEEMEKAVSADPRNPVALYNLGMARERRRDFSGALALYRESARHAPGYLAPRTRARLLQDLLDKGLAAPPPGPWADALPEGGP